MNNLKKIRLKSGFTQEQIAESINITTRNYQYMEYGKRLPRVDRALAIAKVLNTTVEDLFELPRRQTKGSNKKSQLDDSTN